MRVSKVYLVNRMATVVLLVVLAMGCLKTSALFFGPNSPDELSLVFTSSTMAELRPCGCVVGQLGGFARRATIIERFRATHRNFLLVDSGDFLYNKQLVDGPLKRFQIDKSRLIKSLYEQLDYDAVTPGELDLMGGGSELLKAVGGLPWLSVNLVETSAQDLIFPPYKIERLGEWNVAILGATSNEIFVSDDQLSVLAPIQAVNDIVKSLPEDINLIVVLSHLGLAKEMQLAAAIPQIDVIVGGHTGSELRQPRRVGRTLIVQPGRRGQFVGQLRLHQKDKDLDWQDYGPQEAIAEEIDFARNDIELLTAKSTDDPQVAALQSQLDKLEMIKSTMAVKGKRYFVHRLFPLTQAVQPKTEVAEKVQDFLAKQNASYESMVQHGVQKVVSDFIGVQSCSSCHAAIVGFWDTTKHAEALETLKSAAQSWNVDCLGCHTTTASVEFASPHRLAGVQCESCHGPAAAHVARPTASTSSFAKVEEQTCLGCHDDDNDPGFNYRLALPLIRCTQALR